MDRPTGQWERLPRGWRGGEAASAAATSRWNQVMLRLRRTENARQEGLCGRPGSGASALSSLLHPPATPDAIAETELCLGTVLPADYVGLLLCSDGAILTDHRTPGGGVLELLGTAALVRCAEEREWFGPTRCIPELLIFAVMDSGGDHLAFETGRENPHGGCAVLDARMGYRPERWWVVARDFVDWLDRMLTDPGPPGSFGRQWEPAVTQPTLPLLGLSDPAAGASDLDR